MKPIESRRIEEFDWETASDQFTALNRSGQNTIEAVAHTDSHGDTHVDSHGDTHVDG